MTDPTTALFTLALGLKDPWAVQRADFDPVQRQLDLSVDFPRGSRLGCPQCGSLCPVHDTVDKTWRHLDFFQHQAFLHARVPRVQCPTHGTLLIEVPWARSGSGFTLLFEALVMTLVPHMAMQRIAELVGETDQRLWRIARHYAGAAVEDRSLADVRAVGMDETAIARGQRYVTVVADLERGRVIFATPGHDAATVAAFATHLTAHGGDPAAVTDAACDMSRAYTAGIGQSLPNAAITYDHFHLAQLVGNAVDETRRAEVQAGGWQRNLLAGERYTVLRNQATQSESQAFMAKVIAMPALHLKTGKAYRMRLAFQDAMALRGDDGVTALSRWCRWATRCGLPAMKAVAKTLADHWQGVTNFFTSGYTTALMESINSLIQAARARARGYRSIGNLVAMIHLIAGRHDLSAHGIAVLARRA